MLLCCYCAAGGDIRSFCPRALRGWLVENPRRQGARYGSCRILLEVQPSHTWPCFAFWSNIVQRHHSTCLLDGAKQLGSVDTDWPWQTHRHWWSMPSALHRMLLHEIVIRILLERNDGLCLSSVGYVLECSGTQKTLQPHSRQWIAQLVEHV